MLIDESVAAEPERWMLLNVALLKTGASADY